MDKGINLIKSVFFSANEGIIISDRSGNITAANPSSAQMFGYTVEQLESLTIDDLVPHSLKGSHKDTREKYFKHPVPRPMGVGKDLHGLKSNNEIFPLEISLSHFIEEGKEYVTAFITDISYRKKLETERLKYMEKLEEIVEQRTISLRKTNDGLVSEVKERKATEEALRESQKLYELIAENFPNGSVNVLDKNFRFLMSGGKDLLSQRRIDSEARKNTDFLASYQSDEQKQLRIYLQNGLKGIPGSYEHVTGMSTAIMHIVPIRNSSDAIDKLLVVEENISDQKKAEDEIRKALSKERELNEMKSRFVSMASHEFRTPLTTILSSTNLMARYIDGTAGQEKIEKHIGRIKGNIKNLTDILNDFLSLEKLESGLLNVAMETIDLCPFVHEITEETTSILKQGQYFEVNCQQESEVVVTDPKILKNILLNIISNASKYSEEGKSIRVKVFATTEEIEVWVEDEGMGIPKEEQHRMFERFFRARNAANIQGTGLGLFIVSKYVNLLNGKIDLESKEGKGTTIKISIKNG